MGQDCSCSTSNCGAGQEQCKPGKAPPSPRRPCADGAAAEEGKAAGGAAVSPRLARAAELQSAAEPGQPGASQHWEAQYSAPSQVTRPSGFLGLTYFDQDLEELLSLPSTRGASSSTMEQRPTFRFRSGGSYTGQWCGNMRHGAGVQRWQDGAVYEGEWRKNCAEGKGRFTHTDGDVYCGEWHHNVAHGRGIYYHQADRQPVTCYAGQWVNDLQHGFGVETWEEGCKYEGEFKEGQKDGLGVYYWADGGSLYQGRWRGNNISGPGAYCSADKREFKGQWQGSKSHGCGVYSWPDGRVYSGQYENDRKSGFGSFTWPDKRKYDGYWLAGKQHGQGRYHHMDGSSVLALWAKGKRVEWLEEPHEVVVGVTVAAKEQPQPM